MVLENLRSGRKSGCLSSKERAAMLAFSIICVQAGNVNTGAFDPFPEICERAHAAGGWVYVDGAFGLWVITAPSRRTLRAG